MIDDNASPAINTGFRKPISLRNNGLMRRRFSARAHSSLIRPADPLARRSAYTAIKMPIISTSRNRRYLT